MLFNELSQNAMKINKVEKLLDNVANKMKQERDNSRSLHFKNENYKEMIVELGVNLEDTVIETLIQSS